MNWETSLRLVDEALEKPLTWNLAVAFTQENDSEKVCAIVAEQYEQANVG